HRLEEGEGVREVVPPVLPRVGHRLSDEAGGREVDGGPGLPLGEEAFEPLAVPEIPPNEGPRDGGGVPFREVVAADRLEALPPEPPDRVASDVARPARDEDQGGPLLSGGDRSSSQRRARRAASCLGARSGEEGSPRKKARSAIVSTARQ